MNNIKANHIVVGKEVYISPTAKIGGISGQANRVEIGDGTYIGDGVQIMVDDLKIGDYCKVHKNCTFHGYKPLHIGHNAWIGQNTIIDSIGGVLIGNNCGIGAYSQLWSHIRYGDPLAGCNYESSNPLTIGEDVWFVGHCIVSPIQAGDRSMALVGSVITRDMSSDRVYGGSPAKDLTDKMKPQFSPLSVEEKRVVVSGFELPDNIKWIESRSEIEDSSISYFNIVERKYTKRGTSSEIQFMRTLQSKLIKFIPYADT